MKNKFFNLALILLLFVSVSSCMTTLTKVVNTQYLEQTEEEYVNEQLKRVQFLDLTTSQMEESEELFSQTFKELRENAHNQKSGKISGKASKNNFIYLNYKEQIKFEKLLTKEQLIKYRERNSLNADQLKETKRKLDKMGFDTSI